MQSVLETLFHDIESKADGPFSEKIYEEKKCGRNEIKEYLGTLGLDISEKQYDDLFFLVCKMFDAQLADRFVRGVSVGFKLNDELDGLNSTYKNYEL